MKPSLQKFRSRHVLKVDVMQARAYRSMKVVFVALIKMGGCRMRVRLC